MAKNNNAIYAPGELSRVRGKLGVTDAAEAKRMAMLLGGEVGTERAPEEDKRKSGKNDVIGGKKRRRIDISPEEDAASFSKAKRAVQYPGDDPSVPSKLSYSERIKIDQYAGQIIFEIKNINAGSFINFFVF